MFESTEKARFELRNKLDGAEAALAKQRPLIEAAKKARRSTLGEDRVFWGVDEDAILRANLDYRNKTEKKGE